MDQVKRSILSLSCVLLTTCIPSLKDTFVNMTYPTDDPQPDPARDLNLTVGASIMPSLVTSYVNPQSVGACLGSVANSPQTVDVLFSYGHCLATSSMDRSVDRLKLVRDKCMRELPWLVAQPDTQPDAGATDGTPATLNLHAACAGVPINQLDEQRLLQALTDAGEALFAHYVGAKGHGSIDGALPPNLRQAFVNALQHSARVLNLDVPRTAAAKDRRAKRYDQPSLALSGGAANGAFTAGYMFAMLSLREDALKYADPVLSQKIEVKHRFGSAAGTSVGSLVSMLLDLYFSDFPENPTPAEHAQLVGALHACLPQHAPTTLASTSALRECALSHLEKDLVQNEWDLLCAQDGSLTDLNEKAEGLLKFNPLMERLINPFVRDFGTLMLQNDFTRVPMAVDLTQDALVPLDERACGLPGMPTAQCLSQAVLTSVSEPAFVPTVPKIYSGITGVAGEKGAWLDGGIRSGTPALWAVNLTRGRVLAVNTHRVAGLPRSKPANALGVVFTSLGAFADQVRQWEMADAQFARTDQQDRLCAIGKLVAMPLGCPSAKAVGAPTLQLTGDILPVYVPEDITPNSLIAAGYAFDPEIMQGLFLWGEKTFLDGRATVFKWLDWDELNQLEVNSDPFKKAVAARLAAVESEIAKMTKEDTPERRTAHRLERQDLLRHKLGKCQ